MYIEVITETPIDVAEGPFWDSEFQCLYFVDIFYSEIHKYVPETGKHTSAKVGGKSVSLIIPIKGKSNKFIIAYGNALAKATWDGESEKIENLKIISEIDPEKENILDDGKISPTGVLFFGSMPQLEHLDEGKCDASLYCYKNGQVIELVENVSISNGLAWNPDGSKCYHIDTETLFVKQYDCDVDGDPILQNPEIIFDFKKNNIEGAPDGMTIDSEGKLWIASYGGYCIVRVDPDSGEVLKKIELPSKNITSVAFGGAYLDELYVTSAFSKRSEEEEIAGTNANPGSVFKITGLGVRGTESLKFDGKTRIISSPSVG